MTEPQARRWALGAVAFGVVLFGTAVGFHLAGWSQCSRAWRAASQAGARACQILTANNDLGGTSEVVGFGGMGLLFTALGAVVMVRQHRNVIGPVFAATGLLFIANAFVTTYTVHGAAEAPGSLPGATALAVAAEVLGGPVIFSPFVLVFLLFPGGRLLSPRWRVVVWALAAAALVQSLTLLFHIRPLRLAPLVTNPLGLAVVSDDVREAVDVVALLVLFAALLAAVASLVVRFRRSRGVERQQLKWFTTAGAFAGATLSLGPLFWSVPQLEPLWGPLFLVATASVPVAATVAILRYRLYDIDVLINRALVYGALTGLLGATYLGLVVALQGLLAGRAGTSDVAVVVSTLAVAALFRPLRSRVQRFIDRRFYRRRYDAMRTLEAFSTALRQETDVATVRAGLLDVVHDTIQPARAVVWLRADPPG